MTRPQPSQLSVGRNLKIALFHLGSGMADVLTTGVWNRVMVADLGFSAALVGLLTGLRYFLAPLGVLAGRWSDTHTIGGYRRLFWIWLGRATMVLSTLALGFVTAELVRSLGEPVPAALWMALAVSFLLFSLGNAISGSTFLALIYDRAAPHQRGRAVGLVWTFLLIGFAASGVFFSVLLPQQAGAALGYSADALLTLFLAAAAVMFLLWVLSMLREERRAIAASVPARDNPTSSLRADLSVVWRSPPLRHFLLYLTISMLFAFFQDSVLEPFAGQVFSIDASQTNRYSAYWGTTAILSSFSSLALMRASARFTHSNVSMLGLAVLAAAYFSLSAAALLTMQTLVMPSLLLLGLGLGAWNIGTLGMMMDMSPKGRAGTFLGFWSFSVTIARGLGVAGGGVILEIAKGISGEFATAYGTVFVVGMLGILFSAWSLRRVKRESFHSKRSPGDQLAAMFSLSMD
ncbi:MAG: BCD family MFS transporter [Chloroflexi bacterium]|nr:BCD family MFS transporter [Chloroflexota bacterium]MXX82503.1 BCD family MFS transporter [Chloroflexota bacterium]MYE79432.1 BCD family MFS transporter [Chloroflexota bacterium]